MTFEDLPENWAELPVTTPTLTADLVDLLFTESDRAANSILAAAIDENGLLIREAARIVIGGVDWRCPESERMLCLHHIATLGAPGMLLAFGSERWIPPHVLRQWRDDAVAAFRSQSTDLVGVFVASVDDVVDISEGPMPVLWAA